MSVINSVTVYDAITSIPASPAEVIIGNLGSSVKLDISGTNTSRNITFGLKFSSDDTSVSSIEGYNEATAILATSTTGNNENWSFDGLNGYYSLVVTVSSLSGGNLTIKAKVL